MLATLLLAAVTTSPYLQTWNTVPDRVWIGSDWWANRLQDWQIEDGSVRCIETRPRMAMRTAHLLTRTIDAQLGEVVIEVDILPPTGGWPDDALAGMLLGGGSADIDHRLTAQTHHVPAVDGGMLVVLDAQGTVRARSFEQPMSVGGQWSIQKTVSTSDVPELVGQASGEPEQGFATMAGPVHLIIRMQGGSLTAEATTHNGRTRWASKSDIPASMRSGGVALVSHGGRFGFDNLIVDGTGVVDHEERAWGPVLNQMYTVDDGVLKLTAQFPPMDHRRPGQATLEVNRAGDWHMASVAPINRDSWTATFRVSRWDSTSPATYRVRLDEAIRSGPAQPVFGPIGHIPAEPTDGDFVLAALNCQKIYTGDLKWNHDGLWLPHIETVQGVASHDPDLLFFAGDQIYEGDLTPVDSKNLTLDYLYKWYRWCWAFAELTRDTPTVVIPDDHDVYHGNIWGAGGRKAVKTDQHSAQDSGGYRMPADFINVVHRTQTSHLPDPPDPEPIEQGITVYFTDLDWGGVSSVILADRMFKSSPSVAVPQGQFKNGWPQAEGFDAATQADVPGAQLLGHRQERLLQDWSTRDDDRWASLVLSQTPLSNLATLPPKAESGSALPGARLGGTGEFLEGYTLASDGDSNGWPQTPRNRAVGLMADVGAIHVCGDQHLGAVMEYGVDDFDDGAWVFSVPAISNTWPRRWFPPTPGANRSEGAPRYTGEFLDGFGNRIRVHAVANPASSGRHPANLHDRMPGYGIIRLNRSTNQATLECWKRPQLGVDEPPTQYSGWPITFPLQNN